MQVKVACVKSGVERSGNTQDAVGICLVIEAKAANTVNQFNIFCNVRIVDAGIFRVGEHDARDSLAVFINERLQCVQVRISAFIRHECGYLEAGC